MTRCKSFAIVDTAFATPFGLRTERLLATKQEFEAARCRGVKRFRMKATAASQHATADTSAFDDVVMRSYARYPLTLSHGKGATLFDVNGKEYLDFVAGIATCTLGHADSRIVEAVSAQIRKLGHVSNLYYTPGQGQLARWLVDHGPADKVFFCNSGAEANEAAIKLARKYWHKRTVKSQFGVESPSSIDHPVILTARNSFHGRTLATISATGQPKYQQGFQPLMPGFQYVNFNDVEDLRATASNLGACLAGIMLEALQGEGGVCPGEKEFFHAARQICDETGALLICDEVQVGVGRTGCLWGFEKLAVEPDVFTVAKGLGGGVPIGAMLCKNKCDVFEPGDHASTFGGNPLAAAAALAISKALDNDHVLENVVARGDQLRVGLNSIKAKHPDLVAEVRGWGLINGVVLADHSSIKASNVVSKAMELGLLVVPAGPTVVRFVPPLVVTQAEVDSALSKFSDAVSLSMTQ